MAEKLSIQIALEGGAEIEKQLAGIGEAGQKAFADISKSAEAAGGFKQLKPDDVTAKLQEMGVTGVDAIKKIQNAVASARKLETLVQGISSVETGLLALGRAAGPVGIAIVAAMTAAAKATIAFAETISKASEEAAKLGISFEKFQKAKDFFEQLGASSGTAADGLKAMQKAADAANFEKIKKAADDIKKFGLSIVKGVGGFEIIPQQFKDITEAAKGVGPAADFARKKLEAWGMPLPTPIKSLQDFRGELGNDDQAMAAFLAQLKAMPPGLDRMNAAAASLGPTLGTSVVQSIRAANGEMDSAELNAYKLQTALNALATAWEKFGSLTFSPALVQGINLATAALGQLDGLLTRMNWSAFGTAASVTLNPLPNLLQLVGAAILDLGSKLTGITWDSIKSAGVDAWNAIVSAVQGAGTAITTFVSALTGITWDTISSAGVAAWNAIVTAVQATGTAITEFVSSLASITWDAISSAGVAAWNALTDAIQGAIEKLLKFIGLKPSTPETGGGAPGKARGGLLGGRGTGTSDSNLAWVSRGEHIMPAAIVRQPGVLAFLEALRRGGGIPGFAAGGPVDDVMSASTLRPIFNQVINLLKTADQAIFDAMSELSDNLFQLADALKQSLHAVFTKVDHAMAGVQGNIRTAANTLQQINPSGHAGGGLLSGRGTGTSDSNLAWVSRGEYITPARAVAQPGVLAFLEALRRSGGNLRGVLDGMGRFALGGMVPRPALAFARGGLAGGMSNVTIQFPGLPAIGGLRASSDVVDQLHRAAALAQVRSGGRKPSRYS